MLYGHMNATLDKHIADSHTWETSATRAGSRAAQVNTFAAGMSAVEVERIIVHAEHIYTASKVKARDLAIISLLIADRSCNEAAAQLGLTVRVVEHVVERLKLQLHKSTLHGLIAYLVTDPNRGD